MAVFMSPPVLAQSVPKRTAQAGSPIFPFPKCWPPLFFNSCTIGSQLDNGMWLSEREQCVFHGGRRRPGCLSSGLAWQGCTHEKKQQFCGCTKRNSWETKQSLRKWQSKTNKKKNQGNQISNRYFIHCQDYIILVISKHFRIFKELWMCSVSNPLWKQHSRESGGGHVWTKPMFLLTPTSIPSALAGIQPAVCASGKCLSSLWVGLLVFSCRHWNQSNSGGAQMFKSSFLGSEGGHDKKGSGESTVHEEICTCSQWGPGQGSQLATPRETGSSDTDVTLGSLWCCSIGYGCITGSYVTESWATPGYPENSVVKPIDLGGGDPRASCDAVMLLPVMWLEVTLQHHRMLVRSHFPTMICIEW